MWIYGLSNCVCAEVDICGATLLYCRPLRVRTLTRRGLQNRSTVYEHRVYGGGRRGHGDGETDEGREVRRCERSSSATRKYNPQGLSYPRFMISVRLASHLYARVVLLWMLEQLVWTQAFPTYTHLHKRQALRSHIYLTKNQSLVSAYKLSCHSKPV